MRFKSPKFVKVHLRLDFVDRWLNFFRKEKKGKRRENGKKRKKKG